MTPEMVTEIGRQAIETTLLVSGPILGLALAVGLAVSVSSGHDAIERSDADLRAESVGRVRGDCGVSALDAGRAHIVYDAVVLEYSQLWTVIRHRCDRSGEKHDDGSITSSSLAGIPVVSGLGVPHRGYRRGVSDVRRADGAGSNQDCACRDAGDRPLAADPAAAAVHETPSK